MPDPIVTMICKGLVSSSSFTTTLVGMEGVPLFPTIQGSGDAFLEVYLGPLLDGGTLNPLGGIPAGYFPGVLQDNLIGFTHLAKDPVKSFGSANVNNDVGVSFPTVYGFTQTEDSWHTGRWVFAAQVLEADVFSTDFGIGWGREYNNGVGMDPNFWVNNGQYGVGDVNGGALIYTGGFNTYHPNYAAQGVLLQHDASVQMGLGTTFVVAIDMDPPIQLTPYDPQKLIPQFMPCVPCCPVPCNGRFV